MRNKIITITVLVLLILITVAMIKGIKIGNLQILSISQIKEKNNSLNSKIEEASQITSIKYLDAQKKMEEAYNKQQIQKEKYEELVDFNNLNEKSIYETKQYDIGYLWKIFGNYASKYNLTIGMDVKKATGKDLYDLYFDVLGEYTNIIKFISAIEDNSELYFRIYNFNMVNGDKKEDIEIKVKATFNVKGVNLNPDTLKEVATDNISSNTIENLGKSDNN